MLKKISYPPVILILVVSWILFVFVSNNDSFCDYSTDFLTNIPDVVAASPLEWYRTLTSLFLSNYGLFELTTNSIELITIGIVMTKVTTSLEFISIFIVSGSAGNLLADLFITFMDGRSMPFFLSTEGISGLTVGMSTSLCGLLFYTLFSCIGSDQHISWSKGNLFILSLLFFITMVPWSYPFLGKGPLDITDFVHIGGSLSGSILGIAITVIKGKISRSFLS